MAAKRRRMLIIDGPAPGGATAEPGTEAKQVAPMTFAPTGTPGYFSAVQSNIKGRNMSVPLSPCTAIVSTQNRAGKTAVLDAIRLALTGKHPIGPHAADLAGLTAEGVMPYATLEGAAAGQSFMFPDKGKTPRLVATGDFAQLTPEDIQSLLPMVSHASLLTLGTTKAREELFSRFGVKESAEAQLAAPPGLADPQKKLWEQAIRAGTGDIVERLTAAGTWLRSFKRSLSAKVTALEEEKARLHAAQAAVGAGAATDDLVRDIERKLDIHKNLDNTHIMRERAAESESRLRALISVYQETAKPATDEEKAVILQRIEASHPLEELLRVAAMHREPLEGLVKNVRLFTLMLQLRKMMPNNGCLACNSPVEHAKADALVAEAEGALNALQQQQREVAAKAEEAEQAVRAAAAEATAQTHSAQAIFASVETAYNRVLADLKVAKAHYMSAQEMLTAANVQEAPAESRQALQEQLQALQHSVAESGRASDLATEVRALAAQQGDVKAVETALGTVFDVLVLGVRQAAMKAVNKWMPPGFKANLCMEDSEGKPACRWEIVGTDGKSHPRGAASGAEWAALVVAIACAWSEGQKFCFLLLDDADLAGFNAENVRNALTMVAGAVKDGRLTQAFVAWSRPSEIPTEGWSVVTLA